MEQNLCYPSDVSLVGPIVACIPVCNEEAYIKFCLNAFAEQDVDRSFYLLLLLNNCTDRTLEIVTNFTSPPGMHLFVEERRFPPSAANAGYARHIAMQLARQLAGAQGVLLCTDADAVVPRSWVRKNLQAIAAGADAVFGRTELDPRDYALLPPRMHEDEAAAQLLTRLIDQIDCVIDPDPFDPWPRHAEHSGASIAVTSQAFDASGGIPCVPSSEDRAFFLALRRVDARIRHDPEIAVTVSGRLEGRAPGGMAETLRRRLIAPDIFLDDCIEAPDRRQRRARIRACLRRIYADAAHGTVNLSHMRKSWSEMKLPASLFFLLRGSNTFGTLWQELEKSADVLKKDLVPSVRIRSEIDLAESIIGMEVSSSTYISQPGHVSMGCEECPH